MKKDLTLGTGRDVEWVGRYGWLSKDGEITHVHVKVPDSGWRTLPVALGDSPDKYTWGWNGDKENPTLEPSISTKSGDDLDKELWHGYLRNGVFTDVEGNPVE